MFCNFDNYVTPKIGYLDQSNLANMCQVASNHQLVGQRDNTCQKLLVVADGLIMYENDVWVITDTTW